MRPRKLVAVSAVLVAAALIAGLAAHLVHTQGQGRAVLRDSLGRRAALTGRLIGSAFTASAQSPELRAQFGGSRGSLARAVRRYAAADPQTRLVVLDAHGHVMAATPGASANAGAPDVATALRGRFAISDERFEHGRPVVEIAAPLAARSGRRVLVEGGSVQIVSNFATGFFASASAIRGARGYLLDGHDRLLAGSPRPSSPGVRLLARLRHDTSGAYGDRTFVAARVPFSRWRVVLTVPSAGLYASVDGAPRRAAWQLFALFTAAILALLALGFVATRGARRLAAATEREEIAQRLAHERLHDSLTGLPNRTLFFDRTAQAIAAARRGGRSVSVIFLDVDHFKRVNDTLGHAAGDEVLREIARRMSAAVRAGDTVSRLGGDEFVVLCEVAGYDDVMCVVERLEERLRRAVPVEGREARVTVSMGVAVHRHDEPPVTEGQLVRDADAAMYRAKDRGRARVEVFDTDLHRQASQRREFEQSLRQALADEQFVVHYQPIVGLPDGDVRGVEALVRWQAPDRLVGPDEFIPLAEETGLICELGAWVLRRALHDVQAWARAGLVEDDFELSVNVSARQLADRRFAATVQDALGGWDRPAGSLCLEITESSVMADRAAVEHSLDAIVALGVGLAIDDFGVGYSSLGQLARTLPVSVLKLDRSFVAGMGDARDDSIIEAAASLARALALRSVAEGVESADQAERLATIGFTSAQGYYFGRPAEASKIAAALAAGAPPRTF